MVCSDASQGGSSQSKWPDAEPVCSGLSHGARFRTSQLSDAQRRETAELTILQGSDWVIRQEQSALLWHKLAHIVAEAHVLNLRQPQV